MGVAEGADLVGVESAYGPSGRRDPFISGIRSLAILIAAGVIFLVPMRLWDADQSGFSSLVLHRTDWRSFALALSFAVPVLFFAGGARSSACLAVSRRRWFADRHCLRDCLAVVVLLVGLVVVDTFMRLNSSPTCGAKSCVGFLPMGQLRLLFLFLPLTLVSPLIERVWRSSGRAWLVVGAVVWVVAGDVVRVWAMTPLQPVRTFAPVALCVLAWTAGLAYAEGSLRRLDRMTLGAVCVGCGLTAGVSVAVWPYDAYVSGGVPTLAYLTTAVAWISALCLARDGGTWCLTRLMYWMRSHRGVGAGMAATSRPEPG